MLKKSLNGLKIVKIQAQRWIKNHHARLISNYINSYKTEACLDNQVAASVQQPACINSKALHYTSSAAALCFSIHKRSLQLIYGLQQFKSSSYN